MGVDVSNKPCPSVQSTEAAVTTHKHAALSAALSETAADAASNLNINIADVAAAAILHKSPTFKSIDVPSHDSSAVPKTAIKAENQVGTLISRPKSILAKNGTNLTFRYSKNPDRCAVVYCMSRKCG